VILYVGSLTLGGVGAWVIFRWGPALVFWIEKIIGVRMMGLFRKAIHTPVGWTSPRRNVLLISQGKYPTGQGLRRFAQIREEAGV
jgi:hypothetical protein